MKFSPPIAAASLAALLPLSAALAAPPTASPTLATLKQNQGIAGFTTLAVYTGDGGKPIGARFRHIHTGYMFDYLQMDSVPQAFIYVNTPPTSDKGEPHTQEHLLLGKGNRGRTVATSETLTMSSSSAYTEQWRTCYFFNTTAGADVFYEQLRLRLDALLHPDYTDEEVRREVRNFGVTENADGTLRLEEKGTVYNEMVSTMDKSGSQLYRTMNADLYGANHPLAFEAGGTPEALRTLTPDEIKAFRARDYYLGNMGMVASFPGKLPLTSVLTQVGKVLTGLQPQPSPASRPPVVEPTFPAPTPAVGKDIQIVAFPDPNAEQPGDVALAWPADRKLGLADYLLLQLFLENIAGDADTPLYKRFIDAKTRTIETGATGVYAYASDDLGQPVYVGLSDVKPTSLTEAGVEEIRKTVLAEFARIAALPDGSPELLAFNAKLQTRLQAYRRGESKFVNSPPGFGRRMSSASWMNQCRLLESVPGFRKSVLLTPETDTIARQLESKSNIWRGLLAHGKITGAMPYAVGSRADPALVTRQATERAARVAAEVARLRTQYGATDDQAAIRRYRAEYDAETVRQSAIAATTQSGGRFLDHPPLTLDDELNYHVTRGPVSTFAANFDTMTSATVRLNLPLGSVTPADRIYLAALPTLLDSVGVIEKGVPISYEEMLDRQRREILSVGCGFDTNPYRKRYELEITGSGNNLAETKRAVGWMRTLLTAPNWRMENLPRLRDLVDQMLQGNRNRMLGQEEYWVSGVGSAWRYQTSPLALTTGSFLTQTHDLQRLRWMLKDAPTERDGQALVAFLTLLGKVGGDAPAARSDRERLLKALGGSDAAARASLPAAFSPTADAFDKLPSGAKSLAKDAASDLAATLSALPDDSLTTDWTYLCAQMAQDFRQGPRETLNRLNALRQSLLQTAGARMSFVGSMANEAALQPSLQDLTAVLRTSAPPPSTKPADSGAPTIINRLRQRIPDAAPTFVGLIAPSMKGGVVMNQSPSTSYTSLDDDSLLRYLAGSLYGGGGAESMFMKTWGAGLAYSSGIGSSLSDGSVSYYADHTPEMPQTVRFVIDSVKNAPRKPDLVEYSLATAFRSRADGGYESRAFAMANDLADGLTPGVIRAFRNRLLALRTTPTLVDSVYSRLPDAMQPILPGYAVTGTATVASPSPNAHYFVIGPEKQMSAYEGYLKNAVGPQTTLYRLYPRDFWFAADVRR